MSHPAVLTYLSFSPSPLSSFACRTSEYTPLIPPRTPKIKNGRNRWVENVRSIHNPINIHKKMDVSIVIPSWVINENIRITGPYFFISKPPYVWHLHECIISFLPKYNHHIFTFPYISHKLFECI